MEIIVNTKPKTGARTTGNNCFYYTPHIPEFVKLNYKFRRETNNGTQVRDSVEDDWFFAWDLQ